MTQCYFKTLSTMKSIFETHMLHKDDLHNIPSLLPRLLPIKSEVSLSHIELLAHTLKPHKYKPQLLLFCGFTKREIYIHTDTLIDIERDKGCQLPTHY